MVGDTSLPDGSLANLEGLWYARKSFKSLPFAMKEVKLGCCWQNQIGELLNMPTKEIMDSIRIS